MENDDLARNRWLVMTVARLAGAAMVVIALLILSDKIPGPHVVGYVVLAAGMIDIFVVPQMLARKWRSPPGTGQDAGIE